MQILQKRNATIQKKGLHITGLKNILKKKLAKILGFANYCIAERRFEFIGLETGFFV